MKIRRNTLLRILPLIRKLLVAELTIEMIVIVCTTLSMFLIATLLYNYLCPSDLGGNAILSAPN